MTGADAERTPPTTISPLDFYQEHIDRCVVEALKSVTDVHACKQACAVLNSFIDYWARAHQPDPDAGNLRGRIAVSYPEFALLRDIAEAHKHAVLDRPNRKITNTNQAQSRAEMWKDNATATWESPSTRLHSWESSGRMVLVDADDGSSTSVIDLIVAVDTRWRDWLKLNPRDLTPYAPR